MSIEVGTKNDYGVMRCPICGKDDWCSIALSRKNGTKIFSCKRRLDKQNVLSNVDGKFYVFLHMSARGNASYQEANDILREGNYETSFENTKMDVEKQELFSDSKLDIIYSTMLSYLSLSNKHRIYLKNEGWSEELIEKSRLVSLPVQDRKRTPQEKNMKRWEVAKKLEKEFGDLRGVPGIYYKQGRNESVYPTFAMKGGILLPVYNHKKQIVRLRIRLDEVKKKKYRNFSSYHFNQETGKNSYEGGCQAGNRLSFFYEDSWSESDFQILYITEGWKKGFIIKEYLNVPAISLPGTNNASLFTEEIISFLKEKGTNYLISAFDADKNSNQFVQQAEKVLFEKLGKDFKHGYANWSEKTAKGIDDLLISGRMPSYSIQD